MAKSVFWQITDACCGSFESKYSLLQWGNNSSSQDFWAHFFAEIWVNSSNQKIPGLISYAYPSVENIALSNLDNLRHPGER